MRFQSFVLSSVVCLSTAFLAAADVHIDRVNQYIADHSNLTSAQASCLNFALSVANSKDQAQADALRAATEAAFGKSEAVYILTGKTVGAEMGAKSVRAPEAFFGRSSLGKRKADCDCTDDWECDDSCQQKGSCWVISNNCGILGLFDCNGLCGH